MLVTEVQHEALKHLNVARGSYVSAVEQVEYRTERLKVACARAVACGVPLRRVAAHAGVSHVTIGRWVAEVPAEELDGSRLVARAAALGERPGARGRRKARKPPRYKRHRKT